jgi:uncharacterized protein (TIGR02646 family)
MIKLHKALTPPPPLKGKNSAGMLATRQLKANYDQGVRAFEFDSNIYGHPKVKEQLITDQNGKCAFCESKFLAQTYGDVEHFRPKGGYIQADGDPVTTPGYYWLAYEWMNLVFSCSRCNQQYKKNHFPLFNPDGRATHHRRSIAIEQPVLINPLLEDPRKFIGFNEEIPIGLDPNLRGQTTIGVTGIDRNVMNEDRREHLDRVRSLCETIVIIEKLSATASDLAWTKMERAKLRKAVKPLARYSSMTSAFLQSVGM